MKVHNVRERALSAAPERVEALFADMDLLWPTDVFPARRPEGDSLRAGRMLWQPPDGYIEALFDRAREKLA